MSRLRGKIGLIAPNSEIAALAKRVSSEFEGILDVYEGNLEEGVKAARSALTCGSEVFISRGATAYLIETELKTPVVQIVFSGVDLIKTVEKAKQFDSRFAFVGHENLFKELEGPYVFFGYTLHIEKFKEYNDIKRIIHNAYTTNNIKVFMGGEAVVKTARELGLKGILIECGIESIKRAVLEASRLAEMKAIESERYLQFKAITEHSSEGIMFVDNNEKVVYMNPAAKNMFLKKTRLNEHAGQLAIKDLLPKLEKTVRAGKPSFQVYDSISDTKIIANYIPLVLGSAKLGGLVSFQDITRIEELEKRIRREQYAKGLVAKYTFDHILTYDSRLTKILAYAKRIAQTDSSILITGESGTGKELMAQSIHNASPRKNGPFVAINCAALPENILESELFGYVDGAFTGARKSGKAGLFELAHMGTIFLDEIGDIPLNVQSHLLRVIQEKEVVRIGDDRVIPVNIRIISATNKDLGQMVKQGKFREDLYYRLDIIRIKLPSLRERIEDIPHLCNWFIRHYCHTNKIPLKTMSKGALNLLKLYSWPGNVRELQNFMESLVIFTDREPVIDEKTVEQLLQDKLNNNQLSELQSEYRTLINGAKSEAGILRKYEMQSIKEVLQKVNGNKSEAARILGISTTTLWRRLKSINPDGQLREM
ncbi:MAG: sigma 54-interacting transcriptional regulator [Peptococcaceae bacterium]|jgi:transcriptional regulator with PAS, ATPase and Fis domain|nr:sigma 54-interacting transcriptional regulator [Peptococcaceae bacterium]MDH7526273.1 sigma 54-interacting transcriptional regulator [Peptococcaceae bacterium]